MRVARNRSRRPTRACSMYAARIHTIIRCLRAFSVSYCSCAPGDLSRFQGESRWHFAPMGHHCSQEILWRLQGESLTLRPDGVLQPGNSLALARWVVLAPRPEGASQRSPGQRPGLVGPINQPALKGRHSHRHLPGAAPPFQGWWSSSRVFPGRCPGLGCTGPSGRKKGSLRPTPVLEASQCHNCVHSWFKLSVADHGCSKPYLVPALTLEKSSDA